MRLEQALKMGHRMGATQMVLHSLTLWDRDNMLHMGYEAGKVALVQDTMGDAVKMAEDFGITIVLENIEDTDPAWRAGLIDAFGSDRIRLSIDTGHAHYIHSRFGAPHVVDFIKRAGNMLEHVHLQDTDGSADRHWGLGEGQLPWFPIFQALGKLESNPRLIMEPMDVPRHPGAAGPVIWRNSVAEQDPPGHGRRRSLSGGGRTAGRREGAALLLDFAARQRRSTVAVGQHGRLRSLQLPHERARGRNVPDRDVGCPGSRPSRRSDFRLPGARRLDNPAAFGLGQIPEGHVPYLAPQGTIHLFNDPRGASTFAPSALNEK